MKLQPRLIAQASEAGPQDVRAGRKPNEYLYRHEHLFVRLPKRGQLDGSQMRWEYWDGQQWQPYELPPRLSFSLSQNFQTQTRRISNSHLAEPHPI